MKTKIEVCLVFMILLIGSTSVIAATSNVQKSYDKMSSSNENTTLITEFGTGEINEYNESGTLIWSYPAINTCDAERLQNRNTLIADASLNSVIEVNENGGIVWQKSGINLPLDADRLQNGNTLITDPANNRVIEVNVKGEIDWEKDGLNYPVKAQRLENGNTLIADAYDHRVIEVNAAGDIVWQKTDLSQPCDAERLQDGNTLICDAGDNRVIEINADGDIVWEKDGLNGPMDANRLENGNTLIADYLNNRVIEVNNIGEIIWQLSGLNLPRSVERVKPELSMNPLYMFIPNSVSIGKICAYIRNNGGNLSNIYWEINVTAGLTKKSYFANGTISLLKGDITEVCTGNSFGKTAIKLRFGGISGYVLVKIEGFETKIEFSGFIFGRIIIITEYGPSEE